LCRSVFRFDKLLESFFQFFIAGVTTLGAKMPNKPTSGKDPQPNPKNFSPPVASRLRSKSNPTVQQQIEAPVAPVRGENTVEIIDETKSAAPVPQVAAMAAADISPDAYSDDEIWGRVNEREVDNSVSTRAWTIVCVKEVQGLRDRINADDKVPVFIRQFSDTLLAGPSAFAEFADDGFKVNILDIYSGLLALMCTETKHTLLLAKIYVVIRQHRESMARIKGLPDEADFADGVSSNKLQLILEKLVKNHHFLVLSIGPTAPSCVLTSALRNEDEAIWKFIDETLEYAGDENRAVARILRDTRWNFNNGTVPEIFNDLAQLAELYFRQGIEAWEEVPDARGQIMGMFAQGEIFKQVAKRLKIGVDEGSNTGDEYGSSEDDESKVVEGFDSPVKHQSSMEWQVKEAEAPPVNSQSTTPSTPGGENARAEWEAQRREEEKEHRDRARVYDPGYESDGPQERDEEETQAEDGEKTVTGEQADNPDSRSPSPPPANLTRSRAARKAARKALSDSESDKSAAGGSERSSPVLGPIRSASVQSDAFSVQDEESQPKGGKASKAKKKVPSKKESNTTPDKEVLWEMMRRPEMKALFHQHGENLPLRKDQTEVFYRRYTIIMQRLANKEARENRTSFRNRGGSTVFKPSPKNKSVSRKIRRSNEGPIDLTVSDSERKTASSQIEDSGDKTKRIEISSDEDGEGVTDVREVAESSQTVEKVLDKSPEQPQHPVAPEAAQPPDVAQAAQPPVAAEAAPTPEAAEAEQPPVAAEPAKDPEDAEAAQAFARSVSVSPSKGASEGYDVVEAIPVDNEEAREAPAADVAQGGFMEAPEVSPSLIEAVRELGSYAHAFQGIAGKHEIMGSELFRDNPDSSLLQKIANAVESDEEVAAITKVSGDLTEVTRKAVLSVFERLSDHTIPLDDDEYRHLSDTPRKVRDLISQKVMARTAAFCSSAYGKALENRIGSTKLNLNVESLYDAERINQLEKTLYSERWSKPLFPDDSGQDEDDHPPPHDQSSNRENSSEADNCVFNELVAALTLMQGDKQSVEQEPNARRQRHPGAGLNPLDKKNPVEYLKCQSSPFSLLKNKPEEFSRHPFQQGYVCLNVHAVCDLILATNPRLTRDNPHALRHGMWATQVAINESFRCNFAGIIALLYGMRGDRAAKLSTSADLKKWWNLNRGRDVSNVRDVFKEIAETVRKDNDVPICITIMAPYTEPWRLFMFRLMAHIHFYTFFVRVQMNIMG
jgi:hypothetical protein